MSDSPPAKPHNSPWMTRKEAREYLCLSETAVDHLCIPLEGNPRRVKGKIRVRPLKLVGSKRIMPRLLASDVYALLPNPDQGSEDTL